MIKLWIGLILITINVRASDRFENCAQRLHGIGGMSKIRASQICLKPISDDILNCQNQKFLQEYLNPEQALQLCLEQNNLNQNEPTFENSEDPTTLYTGTYEKAPSPQDRRKTVCSITVNSADERETFRNSLDPNEYTFVELLPFNKNEDKGRFIPRDNRWIKHAKEQKIHCDILVISGHFASSFIGSSGFEVKLEDLTKFSCDNEYKELFESVRQIYLFGCNTLASNSIDSRTIRQYREILIEDGVFLHQAQRIAARRYTTYDQTISSEFRKIFPQAEQIFGFPRPSPSGENIKNVLSRYLKIAYQKNQSTNKSQTYLQENFNSTLGKTGMIQVTHLPKDSMTCSEEDQHIQTPEMKKISGIESYVQKYYKDLPIPSIDLIVEAKNRNFITKNEYILLIKSIFTSFRSESLNIQQHMLCPLLATQHASLLKNYLDDLQCLKTLDDQPESLAWLRPLS